MAHVTKLLERLKKATEALDRAAAAVEKHAAAVEQALQLPAPEAPAAPAGITPGDKKRLVRHVAAKREGDERNTLTPRQLAGIARRAGVTTESLLQSAGNWERWARSRGTLR